MRSDCAHSQLDLSPLQSEHLQCAGINIRFGTTDTTVVSVYIPPERKWDPAELRELRKLCGRDTIICGDFNAHHTSWGSLKSTTRGVY